MVQQPEGRCIEKGCNVEPRQCPPPPVLLVVPENAFSACTVLCQNCVREHFDDERDCQLYERVRRE